MSGPGDAKINVSDGGRSVRLNADIELSGDAIGAENAAMGATGSLQADGIYRFISVTIEGEEYLIPAAKSWTEVTP